MNKQEIIELLENNEELELIVNKIATRYALNLELVEELSKLELSPEMKQILLNQNEYLLSQLPSTPNSQSMETFMRYVCIDVIRELDILNMVGLHPFDGKPTMDISFDGQDVTIEAVSLKFKTKLSLEILQDAPDASKFAELSLSFAKSIVRELTNGLLIAIAAEVEERVTINSKELFVKLPELAKEKNSTHMWVSKDTLSMIGGLTIETSNEIGYIGTFGELEVHILPEVNDRIILSRKESDEFCGVLFAPYVLLMSTGMVFDIETCAPNMSWMTRVGIAISDRINDYYTIISVDTIS